MINTKLENLNLLDKFLFDEAMEDREAYQAAVGILLEKELNILGKPETEKEFRVSPGLRQVRLDVVGMDSERKLYFTEMQRRNTGNLIRRSRYYQAQLDVSLLEPGSRDFNLLNESCFILIAPFDLFGKELYRYTFEGTCRECPDLKLEDGAVRVFINTKGKNREEFSNEFLDFIEYIEKTTDEMAECAAGSRIRKIHDRVRQIRKSEKAGIKYMQRWEELAETREDGERNGDLKRLIFQVCKKMKMNQSLEKIAEDLVEEVSVIAPLYHAAEKFAPEYDPGSVFKEIVRKRNFEVTESSK